MVAGVVVLAGVWIAALTAPMPDRLQAADSTVVEYRDGTPAHVFLAPDDRWRIRRPLTEIDRGYVKALLRLEVAL